jgi:hypothetical protein
VRARLVPAEAEYGVKACRGAQRCAPAEIMVFSLTFHSRDFQLMTQTRGRLTLLRCSWRAMGGPASAVAAVACDPREVACLAGLLGTPVMIHDPQGSPYWWGYLHGIAIQSGSLTRRLNLDDLANRLAVYHTLPDGITPNLTGWVEDPASQSIYGIRERILTINGISEESALSWRDAQLTARVYPRWQATRESRGSWPVVLDLHGWYETLAWRHYACESGDDVETTAQMAAIVTACGQFLIGTRVEFASGMATSPFRDGLTHACAELEALAGLGDSAGHPYRLRIDNERVLVVEQVPLPGAGDWSLGSDGVYRDQYGVRQPPWVNPVGRWVRPADWAHTSAQPLGSGDGSGYLQAWEHVFS